MLRSATAAGKRSCHGAAGPVRRSCKGTVDQCGLCPGISGHGHWYSKTDGPELAAYPHRLVDIRDPSEPYSAADFVNDADAAIVAAPEQQQTPIIVGGTMLYVQRFMNGIAELPGADSAMRLELQEQLAQLGGTAMHAQLSAIDPVAAAKIHPNNHQRLLRALEVVRATGQPMSAQWQAGGRYRNQSAANKAGYGSRCADPAANFTSAHSRC